jgi:L,D-transpeptidase ErfK/SrfK
MAFGLVMQALVAGLALTQGPDWPPATVTGGLYAYEVAEGDSLTSVGARFGVDPPTLARDNNIPADGRLRTGASLTVDSRHIAPSAIADGIVLNVAQRMLFVFVSGKLVRAFPVAVGKPDWPTPLGRFEILVKEIDPVWDVPISIQHEMTREGRSVSTKVPPGPDNPLGNRWLALSAPGVGIHGTNQPASIYRFTTHGCIRLHPDDILELFDLVDVGTVVNITYQPVLLARDGDGSLFLEVHPDAYGRSGRPEAHVRGLLTKAGLERLVDTPAVRQVVRQRTGRAVVISP